MLQEESEQQFQALAIEWTMLDDAIAKQDKAVNEAKDKLEKLRNQQHIVFVRLINSVNSFTPERGFKIGDTVLLVNKTTGIRIVPLSSQPS